MIALGSSPYRTSSYSTGNGACIEVGSPAWVKASYSTGENNCVEVNAPHAAIVAFRDSKIDESPVVSVAPAAWSAFLALARI